MQTSSKRPAIHVYFEYICWKFAGRLLDHVNTPLSLKWLGNVMARTLEL